MGMLVIQDVSECWPRVRDGLAEIARKTHEPWTPDDIRDWMEEGGYQLATSDTVFLIWSIDICLYSGLRTFWVWYAYSQERAGLTEYLPKVEDLARCCGADRLAFRASRKGYARVLSPEWRTAAVEYERDL